MSTSSSTGVAAPRATCSTWRRCSGGRPRRRLFGMHHPQNTRTSHCATRFRPRRARARAGWPGGCQRRARMLWSLSGSRGMARVSSGSSPTSCTATTSTTSSPRRSSAPVRRAGVPCVMTLHDYKLACPSYQLLDHGQLCQACVDAAARSGRPAPLQGRLAGRQRAAGRRVAGCTARCGAYDPVDVFVSPSRFLADVMTRAGVFPDRLRVINHFVDVDRDRRPRSRRAAAWSSPAGCPARRASTS